MNILGDKLILKISMAFALVLIPPSITWLMSAPYENPKYAFLTGVVLCLLYTATLFFLSDFLNFKKLNLHDSLASGVVGGGFFWCFSYSWWWCYILSYELYLVWIDTLLFICYSSDNLCIYEV